VKTIRGNYEGASECAYFDKDVQQMTESEMRSLLQFILHEASESDIVYEHLARAEEKAREQGVKI
jgi:hypothetical protein